MRNASPELLAHLEGPDTTVCVLIKMVCADGDSFGFADHDRDVEYADGMDTFGLTYRKREGYEQAQVAAETGLGVDNSEASGRIAVWDYPDHITEEQINAGKLTGAEHWVYLVNYEDLSMGHIELHSGNVGQVKVTDGQVWNTELLALSARMKQDIVPLTSLTCRRVFGDSICGVDAEALFQDFEIASVGVEDDRVFTLVVYSSGPPTDAEFEPGLVRWLTGDNAGTSPEVETNVGATVALATPTRYPMKVGDTGKIRPDCKKRFREDCIAIYDNGLNFDGEPDIPIGDEDDTNRGDL